MAPAGGYYDVDAVPLHSTFSFSSVINLTDPSELNQHLQRLQHQLSDLRGTVQTLK